LSQNIHAVYYMNTLCFKYVWFNIHIALLSSALYWQDL